MLINSNPPFHKITHGKKEVETTTSVQVVEKNLHKIKCKIT